MIKKTKNKSAFQNHEPMSHERKKKKVTEEPRVLNQGLKFVKILKMSTENQRLILWWLKKIKKIKCVPQIQREPMKLEEASIRAKAQARENIYKTFHVVITRYIAMNVSFYLSIFKVNEKMK